VSSLEGLAPIFAGGPGEEGASDGADPGRGDPPPDRGIGFRVFVGLAIVTVAARVVATLSIYGWTPTGLLNIVEGGLVGSAIVLVPAVLFGARHRGRPSSDLVLVAFALIAASDVIGSVASAATTVMRHGTGLTSMIYAIILLGGPALAALTAVGAVLVPIGLTKRWGGPARRSTMAAMGCLGAAVWIALVAVTFIQYLLAYSATPPIAIGVAAIAIVVAGGWIATAWLAASGRAGIIGRRAPVAIGAALIAVGGAVGMILYQVAISDPFRIRDSPLLLGLNIVGALGALGWWLVLLAAIRAERSPVEGSGEPPEPPTRSTIESP
jgi:hypothetical protein